jgi:hypothetical protein
MSSCLWLISLTDVNLLDSPVANLNGVGPNSAPLGGPFPAFIFPPSDKQLRNDEPASLASH